MVLHVLFLKRVEQVSIKKKLKTVVIKFFFPVDFSQILFKVPYYFSHLFYIVQGGGYINGLGFYHVCKSQFSLPLSKFHQGLLAFTNRRISI